MQPVDVLTIPDSDSIVRDLGPLSWVFEELGKSFDISIKVLKRFLSETNIAQSDLSAIDASQLRIAKQNFHQAYGALKLLEMKEVASIVEAMVAVTGKLVQKPVLVTQDSVSKLEHACFAVIEYLESLLVGKNVSLIGLFVHYRNIKGLEGVDRVQPADLWLRQSFQWIQPELVSARTLTYSSLLRDEFDSALLKLIKSSDTAAADEISQLCLGLAQTQENDKASIFWKICAAFFEAIAQKLITADIYVKRTAAGVVTHYNNLQHGDCVFSDRFMQNMLFFCGQAKITIAENSPILHIVQKAWHLENEAAIDYEVSEFGRFDPAILALSKKRIIVAKELWTALAGGDLQKIRSTSEQFKLLGESLIKLYPSSNALAMALINASDLIVVNKQAPSTELAMEVATAILYIEAVFEGWGSSDVEMENRANNLAQRIESVSNDGKATTVEPWIEELYRRVSDKESMGSVVGELRICLSEIEKNIDQYFRSPTNSQVLQSVPEKLRQMRGIFSVLGLSEAGRTVVDMHDNVQEFASANYDFESAGSKGVFDKFGNNLGALGFLIDMLSYQPALVKKLFLFDSEAGTLNPLMGREKQTISNYVPVFISEESKTETETETEAEAEAEAIALNSNYNLTQIPVNITNSSDAREISPQSFLNDESDLKDVFLEEAAEVIEIGLDATRSLLINSENLEAQSTLRRAFHTLKGSSRMVGFEDFGEAAWAFEQVVNTRLADQNSFDRSICNLSLAGLNTFKLWMDDLRLDKPTEWHSKLFRQSADAMRIEGRLDLTGLTSLTGNSESLITAQEPQQPQQPQALQEPQENLISNTTEELEFLNSLEDFELHELPVDEAAENVVEVEINNEQEKILLAPINNVLEDNNLEKTIDIGNVSVTEDLTAKPKEKFELHVIGESLNSGALIEKEFIGNDVKNEDEQFKIIGSLKIGIPLYNVYLNEADEWSRCLVTELDEWAIEHDKPLSISTVNFAHSLAGSSATVGFHQLSGLAKELELALDKVFLQQNGTKADGIVFAQVAEECRRLLHQFAAGFLEDPKPSVLAHIKDLRITKEHLTTNTQVEELQKEDVKPSEKLASLTEGVVTATMKGDAHAVHQSPVVNNEAINLNDDDSELVDSLDVDLFDIFDEEARELLPKLGTSLRKWVFTPHDLNARSEVLRTLHTLKGSARLAGAMRLGELSHRMESEIEAIGQENLGVDVVEPLLAKLDVLQNHFEGIGKPQDDLNNDELINANALPVELTPSNLEFSPAVAQDQLPVIDRKTAVKPPAVSVLKSEKRESRQSVRVRARLLDRLVNQAGEVMLTRTRIESELGQLRGSLGDLTGNLDRLRQQLRDVEFQAETQMQSRMEQAKSTEKSFDPLEFDRFTRVQELTRMMAESVNDVATVQRNLQRTVDSTEDDLVAQARQTRDLQRDLLRTRMEEFESISDRLYRVVRQAAKDSEKQVKLDIVGGSIELDRGVLERMTPSFEHLLRNCIAHGLENSEQRSAVNKDSTGAIAITLLQDGNDVVIEFSDDGAGLNYERIQEQAIAQKLISKSDKLSHTELVNLIFTPGLSTATQITELAGRGIGLDVVRAEVMALGGRIDVNSETNKGTKFKLVLPLTTAVTQVVMMRVGALSFGVPSHLVEVVRRSPLKDVELAYESGYWGAVQENIPFYWAGALLQASQRSTEALAKTNPVVVFRSAGQKIAIHVDEIFGNKEVVIKNLGPQLARLPGLAGMAILVSGAVALIYNPVALAAVYGPTLQQYKPGNTKLELQNSGSVADFATDESEQLTPLILVVDDSITVRRVTQRMLQREGFRVALAVDGLQALEKLSQEIPAVVLSDIEMPRMDGFDLVRNIRADSKLKHLPVVMITSRIAEKHRELAMELGVDHYLGKPYSEEGLLTVLRQYTAQKLNESAKT